MNKKRKLEIIIVDLFKNSLSISDDVILYRLYVNVQKLDINELVNLLENLIENKNKQSNILGKIDSEIGIAKFKLEEAKDQFLERKDINLLIK